VGDICTATLSGVCFVKPSPCDHTFKRQVIDYHLYSAYILPQPTENTKKNTSHATELPSIPPPAAHYRAKTKG